MDGSSGGSSRGIRRAGWGRARWRSCLPLLPQMRQAAGLGGYLRNRSTKRSSGREPAGHFRWMEPLDWWNESFKKYDRTNELRHLAVGTDMRWSGNGLL